jgi:hypothetical protein
MRSRKKPQWLFSSFVLRALFGFLVVQRLALAAKISILILAFLGLDRGW